MTDRTTFQNYVVLKNFYDHKNVGNNGKTKYAFDGKEVIFTYNKKQVFMNAAQVGDCYKISYFNNGMKVKQIHLPKEKNGLILWILGFQISNRVSKQNGIIYEKVKKKRLANLCNRNQSYYYREKNYFDSFYILTYAERMYYCDPVLEPLVGYIDSDITKEEIIFLLNRFPGIETKPKKLMKEILQKRLFFTYEEMQRLTRVIF